MKSILKVMAVAVVLAGFGAVGQSAEAGLFGGGCCCRSSCCRPLFFRHHCCRPVCCETSCCDNGCNNDCGCGGDCGCNSGCGGGCGCNGGGEVKAVEGEGTPTEAAPEAPKTDAPAPPTT